MIDEQRAAFEAEMRKDLGMPEYVELNWEADYVATAWKYYQTALASPEVQAWKKDAGRYRWLRNDCLDHAPAGEIAPVVFNTDDCFAHDDEALMGDALDKSIDAAMEKQK